MVFEEARGGLYKQKYIETLLQSEEQELVMKDDSYSSQGLALYYESLEASEDCKLGATFQTSMYSIFYMYVQRKYPHDVLGR